jgi:hypothetical protein
VSYEPNPRPDEVEAFQSFGGRPLMLLKTGGLLARKGEAGPLVEPSPKKRAALEAHVRPEEIPETLDPLADDSACESAANAPAVLDGSPPAPSPARTARVATPRPSSAPAVARETPRAAPPAPLATLEFKLTAEEFLRLSRACGQLGMSADDVICEALRAWLDGQGM